MGPLHEWMPEQLWPKIKALEGLKQFSGLGDAMHSDSDDWLAWFDGAAPETAKFPGDWQKNLSPFDRLILLRALRPDRCSNALAAWIGDVMGKVRDAAWKGASIWLVRRRRASPPSHDDVGGLCSDFERARSRRWRLDETTRVYAPRERALTASIRAGVRRAGAL